MVCSCPPPGAFCSPFPSAPHPCSKPQQCADEVPLPSLRLSTSSSFHPPLPPVVLGKVPPFPHVFPPMWCDPGFKSSRRRKSLPPIQRQDWTWGEGRHEELQEISLEFGSAAKKVLNIILSLGQGFPPLKTDCIYSQWLKDKSLYWKHHIFHDIYFLNKTQMFTFKYPRQTCSLKASKTNVTIPELSNFWNCWQSWVTLKLISSSWFIRLYSGYSSLL